MAELTFQRFNEDYCRLYKEEDGLYHRLAKHFGLSDSAFWIIYTLEAFRTPVTQTELCGNLSLSKQTVNSSLKQLEQEGHIRLSSGPGRRKYLELTPKGRELAERTARRVLALEERAFRAMTAEEQTGLLALARRHLDLMLQESETLFNTSQEG